MQQARCRICLLIKSNCTRHWYINQNNQLDYRFVCKQCLYKLIHINIAV